MVEPLNTVGIEQAITTLETRVGCSWGNIRASANAANGERGSIAAMLLSKGLVPADCSFVVYGSLARAEVTPGSDVDWTLLVDGQADPQHVAISHAITSSLEDLAKRRPGVTAVFGGLTFSHDLIHQIGGEGDTNRNTTRRILLLLESREIGKGEVRDRVLRAILRRYLEEDHGYHALHDWRVKVPRFLLNDIARYWRIMAVDYATKRRDRDGRGWALRNFKLRMSRKLIFAAGLAMCLSCELAPSAALTAQPPNPAEFYGALQDFLIGFSNGTPLNVLAAFALHFRAFEAARAIFDAYDRFLGILMDTNKRDHLGKLDIDDAIHDEVFIEARQIGTSFQDGLSKLFFATDDSLTRATQRYGVF